MSKSDPDGGRRANAVKPQVGDKVYLRSDATLTPMYLERTYKKDTVEYALCSWTAYEMRDDELVDTNNEKEFLLSDLTLFTEKKRKG